MDIKEISKDINANAHAKGFWDKGIDVPKMLMLIVSEVSEAMEADRISRFYNNHTRHLDGTTKSAGDTRWAFHIVDSDDEAWINWFNSEVKNTFQDELADAAIRIFDLATEMGIDLAWHIEQKVRYNAGRPKMHGGKKY